MWLRLTLVTLLAAGAAGKSVLAQSPVVRGINGSWEAYPLRGEGFGSGVQPKTPVKAPAPVPEPPLKQPYLDEWRALQQRGIDSDFRATGQTGIMIAGNGIPMDAVVSDFEAGAAELLSPAAPPDHWDVIEGQGSLFHPAYAGVSLGLLHGSQPDVIVVCHQPGRTHMLGHPGFTLPSIEETIQLNLRLGQRTNPAIRCGGVSLNTSQLSESEARDLIAAESRRLQLPVADPIRGGPEFERLVDHCLEIA